MCKNTLTFVNQPPSCIGNTLSRGVSTLGKKASVAEEMLPHGVEAAILLSERRNEVLEEEICSGRERYWVRDGGLEAVGVDFDCVEDLEYGGGRLGV